MKWTQDQAISFESACEIIGHLIGIKMEQIEAELNAPVPNQARIDTLRAERHALAVERNTLHVTDTEKVSQIRREYGSMIKAWEATPTAPVQ